MDLVYLLILAGLCSLLVLKLLKSYKEIFLSEGRQISYFEVDVDIYCQPCKYSEELKNLNGRVPQVVIGYSTKQDKWEHLEDILNSDDDPNEYTYLIIMPDVISAED
ncbi:Uncharacterised protein [Oligella urethralis]|uniref:hypothetical protein n=1 Tax=Oligella urethralis TaxID=90245 RepID=UPI000E05319F|nr:hypothetical protein [Oligella urethralis]SUA63428.1 Uncharacterised protein [Oligella urethralis]